MGGKEQLFQSGVSVWASGQRVGQGVCGEPCTRPQLQQASTVGGEQARRFGEERAMGVNDSTGKEQLARQRAPGAKSACHGLIPTTKHTTRPLLAARC